MRSSKKIILGIGFLLITTSSFVYGNTYARDSYKNKGEAVSKIAKWQFAVTDGSSILQNIELKNTYTPESLVEGKIAPGSSGKFDIVIDMKNSDVTVDYEVIFNEKSTKPKNLQFECNGKKANSIKELEEILKGKIDANSSDEEKRKTFTINWKWNKQTGETDEEKYLNDLQDTEDGRNLEEYNLDIIVKGNQVVSGT